MKKANKFFIVYDSLMKEYGPQGWWPLLRRDPEGYRSIYIPDNSTRALDAEERFEICAGAILTQNTNWTNAERALISLAKAGALKPEILAEMDEAAIAELVRPSGYFNQKAKKLKAFSTFFLKKPLPDRDLFLSQWGLGPETADDMLLYAFNVPIFVIDIYTKRLFSRLGFCDGSISYDNLQKVVMDNLDEDILLYKEYHALIVRHAKEHCRKKPSCAGCPLSEICGYKETGRD
jgi:endonuclease-3 related protein